MKFKTTGLSLLELKEKYGFGEKGFYDQDWYKDESFAKEKPPAGEYDIDFETKNLSLTL